jgi:hypothetical protein
VPILPVRGGVLMACDLAAAECFHKRVATQLEVTERGQGWWSMRCPTGHHGPPLRLHVGTHPHVHITYADLGKCPQSETYAWLVRQGIPSGCLAKPKDWPAVERSREFGSDDGKLADAILGEAFGEGTTTERLIRAVVLALGGEVPEGPMCDVLADRLGVTSRMIYRATAELRREGRALRD